MLQLVKHDYSGNWVQVSRLGMPLTNEVVIPIGIKINGMQQIHQNDITVHRLF